MKDRIRKLMEAQHMNQQTFAQLTGINSATLSNIFNGRTSPTLNQVTAIQRRFPSINLNWLLNGEGGMFMLADNASGSDAAGQDPMSQDGGSSSVLGNNQSANLAEQMLDFSDDPEPSTSYQAPTSPRTSQRTNVQPVVNRMPQNIGMMQNVSRKITEIRVFYDDQTWESFVPKK